MISRPATWLDCCVNHAKLRVFDSEPCQTIAPGRCKRLLPNDSVLVTSPNTPDTADAWHRTLNPDLWLHAVLYCLQPSSLSHTPSSR